MVLSIGWAYVSYGGLPWMQAVFYGVGASVIGIITVSSYKLTRKSIGADKLLWTIFLLLAVVTFVLEREIIWLILLAGVCVWFVKAPPGLLRSTTSFVAPTILVLLHPVSTPAKLWEIGWFFAKAGAFVFGSGLAIVPFLYGGVVKEFQWLNEQQFLDAVAVAMITPGPMVITVGFIGYLIAGTWGVVVASFATFIPCYLFTVLPAPYFKKYGKHPGIKAFVDGVTTAAIGAIAGAVIVLGKRTIIDWPTFFIAITSAVLLFRFRKMPEPVIIALSAATGLAIKIL